MAPPELPHGSRARIELARIEAGERLSIKIADARNDRHRRRLEREVLQGILPPRDEEKLFLNDVSIIWSDHIKDLVFVDVEEYRRNGLDPAKILDLIANLFLAKFLEVLPMWHSVVGEGDVDGFMETAKKLLRVSPEYKALLKAIAAAETAAVSPLKMPLVTDGPIRAEEGEGGVPPSATTSLVRSVVAKGDGLPDCNVATWCDVEVVFVSDERVQIRNGISSETRNYEEFGFADGRSGKPNLAWVTLRALAEGGGVFANASNAGGDWAKVEKRIQEIRKIFRKHFGITTDPIPLVEGGGYQASFKIRCKPSFYT
jgi:hypothetical protein